MAPVTRAPFERFVEKIEIDPVTICWEWRGGCFDKGYGAFWFDGGTRQAHRFSYMHFIGLIPDGLEIDHLCRNRVCQNSDHLEAVTSLVNIQRGDAGLYERSKTKCPHGHAYDAANTRFNRDGSRHCRTCFRVREQMRRAAVAA